MSQTVQLATARELASTGSVRDTLLVGQRGGYAVLFKIGVGQQRALVTKEGAPRLFAGIDAADSVLRDIGITRYKVDASGLAEDGVMRRRRPDRAAALKQTHDAAAYLTFLVERADAGRRDPVRHSSEDVEAEMEAILAEHGA